MTVHSGRAERPASEHAALHESGIGKKRSIRNVRFRAACGGKADLGQAMVSELDL
jgi:hypothetical protein